MQCLIETIVFEWRWANRILVSVALCILGIMYNYITYFVVSMIFSGMLLYALVHILWYATVKDYTQQWTGPG